MASLKQRGKYSYRLRWMEHGKRESESFKAFSYEEALMRKKRKESELKWVKSSRLRMNDLWEIYKRARPRRGNEPHEEAYWQRAVEFFGNCFLNELTKSSLNSYKNWLLQQSNKNFKKQEVLLSSSYVFTCLKRLQAIWNFGREEGLIDKENDIFLKFKFPTEAKREYIISIDEFLRLYEHARNKNPLYAEYIRLLFESGWRRGELYNLKWSDIKDKQIILRKTKSAGLDQIFPNYNFIKPTLQRIYHLQNSHCEYVWADKNGKRLAKDTITRVVSRFMKETGFDGGSAHILRHSFATLSQANGLTSTEAKVLLRQSSTAMTDRYTHLIPDQIDEKKVNFLKLVKEKKYKHIPLSNWLEPVINIPPNK